MKISRKTLVGEVIKENPVTRAVFQRFGFQALANPILLKTLGNITTIEHACQRHHVDVEEFLAALRQAILTAPSEEACFVCPALGMESLPLACSICGADPARLKRST